jgi:uncharacterized RDD family membrane protein YckC
MNMNSEQQHEYLFPERPMNYASFGFRFGAVLIDGLILITFQYTMAYLLFGTIWVSNVWWSIANMAISWLYEAIQVSSSRQATIGKKLLNIKVTNDRGNRISFGRATARHFSKILSTIILFIGFLMMLWDDRKQTLHDKIADTLVIQS